MTCINGIGFAGPISLIDWVGAYRDTTAVVNGRKVRVWFSKPIWKAEIDGERVGGRGQTLMRPWAPNEPVTNRLEAREAALTYLWLLQNEDA